MTTTSSGVLGPESALRDEVLAAWRRAELAGLDPGAPRPMPLAEIDAGSKLIVAAQPVLERLANELGVSRTSLFFGDRERRVLSTWVRTPELKHALDQIGITIGTVVDEEAVGNNIFSTPLETGRDAHLNGAEHYLLPFRAFTGRGRLIRHPVTCRVEGVLGIAERGTQPNPLFGPLLSRVVQDIEGRLLDTARESERHLLAAFHHATRRRSTPVAVVGGEVVLANRACLDLLDTTDARILRELLPGAGRRAAVGEELDLGPAGRVVVTAEPIDGVADVADGVLFRLEPARPRPVIAADPPRSSAGRIVFVAGDPGSGRTTTARELAGGAQVITVDCAAAVVESERGWACRLASVADRHSGVLVIDDVHLLSEKLCAVLQRAMATSRCRFVLTSCPMDELPSHVARLAARRTPLIEQEPLRERLADLPCCWPASAGPPARNGSGPSPRVPSRRSVRSPGTATSRSWQVWWTSSHGDALPGRSTSATSRSVTRRDAAAPGSAGANGLSAGRSSERCGWPAGTSRRRRAASASAVRRSTAACALSVSRSASTPDHARPDVGGRGVAAWAIHERPRARWAVQM